jgi:hypothetical protein
VARFWCPREPFVCRTNSSPNAVSCPFIEAEKVDAAVAGDRSGQLFVVGGLDEFVHQLRGEG